MSDDFDDDEELEQDDDFDDDELEGEPLPLLLRAQPSPVRHPLHPQRGLDLGRPDRGAGQRHAAGEARRGPGRGAAATGRRNRQRRLEH